MFTDFRSGILLIVPFLLFLTSSIAADKTLQNTREIKITNFQNTRLHNDKSIETGVTDNGYLITNDGAWCWFADPRALHFENDSGTINSTYIGYIDVHGNIKATQYDFISGKSNEVLIRSYFQPDDHNTPSFLVLPDERIMIFYSRHTDEACFYYRISKKAGDITSLGDEMKIVTKNFTTYPSPFILDADKDHFYLCWRGIKWHPTIARYTLPDKQDKVSLEWGPYQLIQSTAARPYCKYYSNGIDKIYLAYTTGHPDNEYPNYTYFNYIDIKTLQLKDISDTVLSDIASHPHEINKTNYPDFYPKAVVDRPADQRDWIWQTSQDKDGLPVIAMVQISQDKTTHNYYYVKWTGTEWRKTFLACGGGHFHQSEGIELCYSGGMAIDDSNPNVVYCSVPVYGISGLVYELIKYTISDKGIVTSTEQITTNSPLNNIRPYIITNSGNNPLKLVWMYGNYYDWIVSSTYPKGFSTAIHSNIPILVDSINLTRGLILEEDFNGSVSGTAHTSDGVLVLDKNTYAKLTAICSKSFSISLTPCFQEEAYEGVIFKAGNLVYGLNKTTLKPYITVGETTYNSTNLLGNSDIWQTKNRATGGIWWPPVMLKYFNLTITYEDDVLTVYRNGIIDQEIVVKNLIPGDVILGGFIGWIEDCCIFNRALNQGEIKNLSERNNYKTLK
ncbi:MAG: BNR repeat-containing protein [Bacteroidales bacterium]|nr:BNR repeat-containing protein [Bacteroidales bacterium]